MGHHDLPAIPEKLYFTIGEVAKLCSLQTHVLRYWEQEFSQLNPSRRRGSRRYYQRKDVLMVRGIRDLLYNQGFTIDGARRQLSMPPKVDANLTTKKMAIEGAITDLEQVLEELE